MRRGLIAALVVLLSAIVAGAVAVVTLQTGTVTIQEPISAQVTDDLAETLYPGQSDDVVLRISNSAPDVGYMIKVTPQIIAQDNTESDGVFTADYVTVSATADGSTITDCGDDDSTTFCISAGSTGTIVYHVSVDPSAPLGNFYLTFSVERIGAAQ